MKISSYNIDLLLPPQPSELGYDWAYVVVGTVLLLSLPAAIMAYRREWPRPAILVWLLAAGLLLGVVVSALASGLTFNQLRMAWGTEVWPEAPWGLLLKTWGVALACAVLATLLALLQHRGEHSP